MLYFGFLRFQLWLLMINYGNVHIFSVKSCLKSHIQSNKWFIVRLAGYVCLTENLLGAS